MPSIRKKTNKAGRDYYEITVRRGRSQPRLYSRWYPPEGWSQKAIDRELTKVAAEFERQCKAGDVISRKERQERDAQEAAEAALIQTVKQYAERVFMPAKTVTMSENSRASFQSVLNTWVYPAIGEKKLPDVSRLICRPCCWTSRPRAAPTPRQSSVIRFFTSCSKWPTSPT